MYKTAVITDEITQDILVAAKLAKQYGLDALEIRSVNDRNPFQMSMHDAREIKSVADDYGLKICCVASPLYKIDFADKQKQAEHIEALKKTAEFMHLWETNLIRGFTFLTSGDLVPTFEQAAAAYEEPLKIAEDADFTFVIESEPSVTTTSFLKLAEFLRVVNHKRVKALYDPGNEASDISNPPAYPDGFELLRPEIRHVHIKDILGTKSGFEPAMIGEGGVDYDGLIPFLKKEYTGYCSIETHYRITSHLTDEELVHPQGSGFSLGGEEATIAYLDRLDKRWRWREAL